MPAPGPGEFDLIARIKARAGTRADVRTGIGDDAAVLAPRPGHELVVTTDTLVADVHFGAGDAPADVGWKALAVNLSDLAAMGAEAAWVTLTLTLPDARPEWIDAFVDGFLDLAARHDVALVGGDLTRGPLTVGVTAIGQVPAGQALLRSGADAGDLVCVTGTLGDAGAALAQRQAGGQADPVLAGRLQRPTPRVAAGLALRGLATACIDLSDGLLADLGHLAAASGVGARIDLDALPCSDALREAFDARGRWALQLSAGDDYELCYTVPESRLSAAEAALREAGVHPHRIGRIVEGSGVDAVAPDGHRFEPARRGYTHFGEEPA